MPVYYPALDILKHMKLKNYKVCHNFIGRTKNQIKYKKGKIFKLIYTNRQYRDKNPINIVKAISNLDNVKLTLVGNGTENYNIKNFVKKNKLKNKVIFINSINNSEYLKLLQRQDALIIHSNNLELGKSVIEAMSFKKPIIINKPRKKFSK